MTDRELLVKTNQTIKSMVENARKQRNEDDRKYIVASIGKDLVTVLTPLLKQIAENSKVSKDEIKQIIREIKVIAPKVNIQSPEARVRVDIPKIKIPTINVPKPEVTVNVPKMEMPKEMEIKGLKGLLKEVLAVAKKKPESASDQPMNVILTDEKGMPYKALTSMITGGGGGVVSIRPLEEVPVGFEQLAIADTAIPFADIPEKANKATISVEDAIMRYKTDGNDPTTTVGVSAYPGTIITLSSRQAITMFRAIRTGTSSSELNINYYEIKS